MQGISKSFPGVQALQDIDLTVYPGEILALVGENGAGKSTLMKILNGVYAADEGTITWQGQPVSIHSPHDAQALGISMIHQELALIPYLDAGKNIYLGREPQGAVPGTVHWRKLYQQAEADLAELDLKLNVRTPVRFFSIAQQQMIEAVKTVVDVGVHHPGLAPISQPQNLGDRLAQSAPRPVAVAASQKAPV